MQKTILFLDAHLRSTLSMIRSIGALHEFRIVTAGSHLWDLCRFSRFSSAHYIYTSPEKSASEFIISLKDILRKLQPDYIFPGSDITLFAIFTSDLYEAMKQQLIAPDKQVYLDSFDKKKLMEIARSCQVRVPDEVVRSRSIAFPMIVKPRMSRYFVNDRMIHGFRCFVHHPHELETVLAEMRKYDPDPLMQFIVPGKGFGVFVAAKEGEVFAAFAHERIREVPLTGGHSTMRKSVQLNGRLLASSKALIRVLNWTGIAMVEFKGEREEEAFLMEINGRPWGSMDLAKSAGMDFPQMMIDLVVHHLTLAELTAKYNRAYQTEHYSRWIIGECQYLIELLSGKLLWKEKRKALAQLFKIHKNISFDTWKLSDPLPFIAELGRALSTFFC